MLKKKENIVSYWFLTLSALERSILGKSSFRSWIYCPSYGDVRFMVCPLYRDSTVQELLFRFFIAPVVLSKSYVKTCCEICIFW